ncbi:unnamed protein product [Leptosia nina]|uniref:Uncharacterized protein n=1 Tax=Leptosia nina TaxID=320188 RepID=A0AAV1JVQ9_9NEOP
MSKVLKSVLPIATARVLQPISEPDPTRTPLRGPVWSPTGARRRCVATLSALDKNKQINRPPVQNPIANSDPRSPPGNGRKVLL